MNLLPSVPSGPDPDKLANIKSVPEQVREMLEDLQHAKSAEQFVRKLYQRIEKFEASLDEEHEVGVKLVSFGQSVTFHVSAIGYVQPSLILFEGRTESGDPVELMQHVNQISFLLMKLERLEPEKEKSKIGFIQPDEE